MVESAAEASSAGSEKKKSRLAALERRHTAPATPVTSSKSPAPALPTPESARSPAPATASPSLSSLRSSSSFQAKADGSYRSYVKLCSSVFNGPLAANLELRRDSSNAAVDTVVRELLESNAKTAGNIAGTIENRVLDRVLLLDNPATQGKAIEKARSRAHRARSKRSAKHLSMRGHRNVGSFDLPAEFHKYELYLPMNEMWKEYARSLVTDCNDAMIQSRFLTADLHGAIMAVVESKNTSYVGTQGIMIRETDNTFGIMTANDKFRVVPKARTVFMLQLDALQITLFGSISRTRLSSEIPHIEVPSILQVDTVKPSIPTLVNNKRLLHINRLQRRYYEDGWTINVPVLVRLGIHGAYSNSSSVQLKTQ